MKNIARHLRISLVPLFTLAAGCSQGGVVGTEIGPLPKGLCEGSCPSPEYAAAIHAGYSMIQDMAATPDGGVVIAGRFNGDLETPGLVLHQSEGSMNDSYLMKRAADGSIAWVKQIQGDMEAAQLVVRPDGSTVLLGAIQAKANFGTGEVESTGLVEMFFTTIAPDGTIAAPAMLGADAWVEELVALDDGTLLATAHTHDPQTVHGVSLLGNEDFLVRLSAAGQIQLVRGTAGTGVHTFRGLSARPGGGAVLIGEKAGPFAWDGVSIPGAGEDAFVLAIDDSCAALWGSRIDPTPQDPMDAATAYVFSVRAAADGRTFVGLSGPASGDARTIAFQTFDAAGMRLGQVDVGQSISNPWQMTVADNGDVLFVGGSYGALTIAGAHSDSGNDMDAYVARLGPSGTLRWLRTFGAPESIQQAIHVVMSTQGHPVIGGEYNGPFAIDDDALPPVQDNPNAFVAEFAP